MWHAQCQRYGGLEPELQRTLRSLAEGKPLRRATGGAPRPGTQLVREWNGRTYRVNVTKDCYVMAGERFKSLSAIARRITGTSWSGPRFFGLNGTARAGT
ncbi:DUF2924 domain-containing protein [Psychromarinibacter sp. C21-152]|uniref:DUF2924 domain-containing protein n=1 Tax=Psychromarinibacter sediminicola TaxID=3033385 RepID=A0AAE3TCQ4_9RHOB|nr:DUF2924 domain-containing protein [Psychromarinibacter sediminicola]MDF0603910.1 DUF2924 domain-containing protein [Psychromarinibacter sediminicola]